MTRRIDNAINVFIDALRKGTLASGSCVACAVGNLVAAGIGAEIRHSNDINGFKCSPDNEAWLFPILWEKEEEDMWNRENNEHNYSKGDRLIERTEFNLKELTKIENAFEKNAKIGYSSYFEYSKKEVRADQLKGLEAVVQVMLDFDDVKETVQEVFSSRAELIPV